jgi:hypothetical protein
MAVFKIFEKKAPQKTSLAVGGGWWTCVINCIFLKSSFSKIIFKEKILKIIIRIVSIVVSDGKRWVCVIVVVVVVGRGTEAHSFFVFFKFRPNL